MHISERYWRDLEQMFPAREGVSPYRVTISMRMSKWLNLWYYWCAWQMIRTVGDQLKANKISLLDVDHEGREAGKKQKKPN